MMFAPMTREAASAIARWEYGGDYAVYDMGGDSEDTISELLDGCYFVTLDAEGNLMGFACFGVAARIPVVEPFDWEDGSLDVGVGMRPDLCGRGDGTAFFSGVLAFAFERFGVRRWRLSVASWNERAIRVYRKCGFARVCTVTHAVSGVPFDVMLHCTAWDGKSECIMVFPGGRPDADACQ